MPSKRWYLEVREDQILVFYDGQEMKRNGKFVGRIRTLSDGGNEPKAKGYKAQAILVSYIATLTANIM